MKIQARTVFYKVQDAWEKADPTILEGYTTNEFYEFFRKGLENKERFANAPRLFDITDTRVIGCRDYLNNEDDSFVASIEGVPDNETPDIRFSEMYYFVRRDNYWLLDKILHGNAILNILTVSNKEES